MRSLLLPVVVLITLTACNSQETSPGATASSTKTAGKFKEGSDYFIFERVRVLDNTGFTQPAEAFSLLLPKGWRSEGEIIWNAPGQGCDGTNHRFKASSADGKYSIEILPSRIWGWTSNEQLRQFYQNTGSTSFCSYGEPMNAEQYLKNIFGPQYLNNPKISDIKDNPAAVEEMRQSNEKGRQELMRYGAADVQFNESAISANLQWPGGEEGMALCGVRIIETILPNQYNGTYDKSSTMQAVQSVVFRYPAGEKDQATSLFSSIMSSIRTNPSWKSAVEKFWLNVREKKQIAHIGKIRMMDEQTRAMGEAAIRKGNERLNDIDNQMRSWERSQQSQDRMHTQFIKTIREVETYRDETGKIELSSGYNHAWSRSDGSNFILSNNPNFDPSSVFQDQSWKEMKQVD